MDAEGQATMQATALLYAAWRFTSATVAEIAEAFTLTPQRVRVAIMQMRGKRVRESAWEPTLWRLEWRLRWQLAAGPHRA
jgi:hypothetical protein